MTAAPLRDGAVRLATRRGAEFAVALLRVIRKRDSIEEDE